MHLGKGDRRKNLVIMIAFKQYSRFLFVILKRTSLKSVKNLFFFLFCFIERVEEKLKNHSRDLSMVKITAYFTGASLLSSGGSFVSPFFTSKVSKICYLIFYQAFHIKYQYLGKVYLMREKHEDFTRRVFDFHIRC